MCMIYYSTRVVYINTTYKIASILYYPRMHFGKSPPESAEMISGIEESDDLHTLTAFIMKIDKDFCIYDL